MRAVVEEGEEYSLFIENFEEEKGGPEDCNKAGVGKEEVRFFKKEIEATPKPCADILKFTITGNLIALEQAYKDSWLSASELMLIRGLQVKTYHSRS